MKTEMNDLDLEHFSRLSEHVEGVMQLQGQLQEIGRPMEEERMGGRGQEGTWGEISKGEGR